MPPPRRVKRRTPVNGPARDAPGRRTGTPIRQRGSSGCATRALRHARPGEPRARQARQPGRSDASRRPRIPRVEARANADAEARRRGGEGSRTANRARGTVECRQEPRAVDDERSETPKSAACVDPTASMTARTSSMRCSSLGGSVTGSERPVPRLSRRIRRENGGKAREKARERRLHPEVVEVRHPTHDEHQVDRSVADDLVGDVDVAAPRVPRGGRRHRGSDRRHERSRAGEGGEGWRDGRHARNEPVAAAMGSLDELRNARIVAERPADLADAHLEGGVAHVDVRPHGVEQLMLGDQPARVAGEEFEDGKRLGRERDASPPCQSRASAPSSRKGPNV